MYCDDIELVFRIIRYIIAFIIVMLFIRDALAVVKANTSI